MALPGLLRPFPAFFLAFPGLIVFGPFLALSFYGLSCPPPIRRAFSGLWIGPLRRAGWTPRKNKKTKKTKNKNKHKNAKTQKHKNTKTQKHKKTKTNTNTNTNKNTNKKTKTKQPEENIFLKNRKNKTLFFTETGDHPG
jgi:hypothetical protein